MHPVVDEAAAMCALGLGDFIFVVGKLQVLAAAVDVEVLAEQVRTHRRAFDVPARSAIAPRRSPERLARFRVFPQDEVEWVVLGPVDVDAFAGPQIINRLARELSVARKLAYRKVHVAGRRLVSQSVRLQPPDQFEHLRDVCRRPRFMIRFFHSQGGGVLVHAADEALRQFADAFLVVEGALDDLVVNIGNVPDVVDLQSTRAQPALHHVEHHQNTGMTEMAVIVNCHPTDIHADAARGDGYEVLLFSGQRVVDFQHFRVHGNEPRKAWRWRRTVLWFGRGFC